MIWELFSPQSPHIKRAKLAAWLWTLLIFIACFVPGNELPNIKVPLADKWVHFVLFGVFSLLWLMAKPGLKFRYFIFVFLVGCIFGWLVEELQGVLSCLGRAKDWYDIYADALGAFLGTFLFYICALVAQRKNNR